MNIVIFGPPGAGKGTQAKLIAEKNNLLHLSSGELSRAMMEDDVIGDEIKNLLAKGELVPDKIIIKEVEDYIVKNINSQGFVFDGYPRNIVQAEALNIFCKKRNFSLDLIINLELDNEEALKRILLRSKTSNRSDDNLQTTKNRLLIYDQRTIPILDYYKQQGRLKIISGNKSIDEVSIEIEKLIQEIK